MDKNMDSIQLKAMGKINLGLDVVRRREDGYHEVRMIMQTVHVYDKVELTKRQDREITVTTNLHFLFYRNTEKRTSSDKNEKRSYLGDCIEICMPPRPPVSVRVFNDSIVV